MKNLTIEQLAEKLKGNLWTKGDLKRIYLERGHNTKKMSTKTWVEQQGDSFIVKCFVECSSQPWQWCKSQQEEVIASVENQIENLIKQENVELIDFKELEENSFDIMVYVKESSQSEPIWFTRELFEEKFGVYPEYLFGGKLEAKIESLYQKASEERAVKQENEAKKQAEIKKQEFQETIIPADAKRIKHASFGLASVIEINEEKGQIKLKFDDKNVGVKTLLIRFAGLEIIE